VSLISFTVSAGDDFIPFNDFGDNPGQLTASYYSQATSKSMIVLLHGCGQNAEELAILSGFLAQAKAHNTALLLPQQSKENNAVSCFNWFSPIDQQKDSGEVKSIVNMITKAKQQFKIDDVYIVGLSAGGAMASNILVHYPQLFSAGAIVAGVPYPCADSLIKAISCMKSGASLNSQELAQALTNKKVKWPNLVVITGDSDQVVNPKNSQQMAEQWVILKNLTDNKENVVDKGVSYTRWTKNNEQVELIVLSKFGHGIPVNPEIENGGTEAPFILKSSISIAKLLADNWLKQ
jgi:poly(hydroxyalkanoate) depolymerase family esterase